MKTVMSTSPPKTSERWAGSRESRAGQNAADNGAGLDDGDDQMTHLKREVPRQRIELVERARLISVLNALTAARLALLVAPAGYGKTTALAQWSDAARASGHLGAWLTLDEDDSEPRQFLSGIVSALNDAGLNLATLASQAERGFVEVSVGACLNLISTGLSDDGRPCFIVLDDYHRCACPGLDKLLRRMIQSLPGTIRFVVSARTRPNIDIPHLLASGVAAELGADALLLTRSESRELLDTEMSDAEFATVFDQTEGWPVALQLARLVLQSGDGVSASIRQLTKRGSHLSTYLADQVLGNLDPEVVDFLLETSILERFNVELTDLIRNRNDSWSFMDKLQPLQSLITPLDDEDVWFRYHHLFAEYLRHLLGQRRPGDVARLHDRASKAFERKSLLVEAVKHAAASGDFARCAHLIQDAGGWRLVLYGGKNQLAGALRQLTDKQKCAYPRLLAAEAYLKLKDGDPVGARAILELLPPEQRLPAIDWSRPSDEIRDAFCVERLLVGYEDNQIDRDYLEYLEKMQPAIPPEETLARGVLESAGAAAAVVVGRLDVSEGFGQSAMASMRDADSVLGLNYALLHSGLAALLQGKLSEAKAYLSQARAMAEENFGEDSGLKSNADILWASLSLWQTGEMDMPNAALDRAFQHVRDADGWGDIYIAGLEARFHLAWANKDVSALRHVIDDGREIVTSRNIQRIDLLVDGQSLLLAMAPRPTADASAVGRRLRENLPLGCWRSKPSLWRPYQTCAFALALWLAEENCAAALEVATDLIECASAMRATVFAVRAQVLRAHLLERANRRSEALVDLRLAVEAASPERIILPFLEIPQLSPLIQEVRKNIRSDGGQPVTEAFISELMAAIVVSPANTFEDQSALSPRELEVVHELKLGSTNKEIARALDMTEHTVKFHLRNIFVKLGVDRRAHVPAKVP